MTEPAPVTIDVVGDVRGSDGAYTALDVRAPAGAVAPRHVRRGHTATLHVVRGTLEVTFDDHRPTLVRAAPIVLPDGWPVTLRVLRDVRVVALIVPAGDGRLLAAAVEPGILHDDRAALLAAAGITLLGSPCAVAPRGRAPSG